MKKEKRKTMQIGKMNVTPLDKHRVQLSIGKATTEVDFKELWGVIFVLSEKEQQDAMMPARKEERMVFSRKHTIEAMKDIKAGDTINVWCEVSIPKTVVEAIAEENGAKVIIQKEETTELR